MSICTTRTGLPLIAATFAIAGCVAPTGSQDTSAHNTSGTLVTPWGGTSAPARQSDIPYEAQATSARTANGNPTAAPDSGRMAISDTQRKQIDEARIALDILDRMAERCVQGGDAAACTTLQNNWATLSPELHKSLAIISGNAAGNGNHMSNPRKTLQSSSSPMNNPPMSPGATDEPTMEKVIPMTLPGTDG